MAILRVLAVVLAVWLAVTSPPLLPVVAPVITGLPGGGVVTTAGVSFWSWILDIGDTRGSS